MPKSPEKIREQIEKLQSDLQQAEQDKRDKNQRKISRAAERSGLDKLTLSTAELESQFKQIAKQKREDKTEKPAQEKPDSNQTSKEFGASANAEAAQNNGNTTSGSSTVRKPVDIQNQPEKPAGDKPEHEQNRRNLFNR